MNECFCGNARETDRRNLHDTRGDCVLDVALAYEADGGARTASARGRRLGECRKRYDAKRFAPNRAASIRNRTRR